MPKNNDTKDEPDVAAGEPLGSASGGGHLVEILLACPPAALAGRYVLPETKMFVSDASASRIERLPLLPT